jgi:hypothetical protein
LAEDDEMTLRYRQLGQQLRALRMSRGFLHRRAFAEAGPLGERAIGDLERGDRNGGPPNFEVGTVTAAEVHWNLPLGTIHRFLSGEISSLEFVSAADLTEDEEARVEAARKLLARVNVPALVDRIRGDLNELAQVAEAGEVLDRAAG